VSGEKRLMFEVQKKGVVFSGGIMYYYISEISFAKGRRPHELE
jgi:hypothetical protein